MYLSAVIRDKETKKCSVIEDDFYKTKSAFAKDIRGNGYAVIRISNRQDLKAQDYGFTSLGEIKTKKKWYESKNSIIWDDDIQRLNEIIKDCESVEL